MPRPYRLLIVCRGNTCRSPMAEAVVRAAVRDAGLSDVVEVSSAGVFPDTEGGPADPRAAEALAPLSLHLRRHRTRLADVTLLGGHDEVLAVDQATLDAVRARVAGDAPPRIGLLGGYARAAVIGDIADPYHGTIADYRRALDEIRAAAEGLVDDLARRLGPGA